MTTTAAARRTRRGPAKALALLDVLIGMAIFALIAVIAVIAVSQFRQRGHLTGVIEDTRSVGLALASFATTSDGMYPTATDGLVHNADGHVLADIDSSPATPATKVSVLTPGNGIGRYEYIPAAGDEPSGFEVCIVHFENGTHSGGTVDAYAIYNTLAGGVSEHGYGNGC